MVNIAIIGKYKINASGEENRYRIVVETVTVNGQADENEPIGWLTQTDLDKILNNIKLENLNCPTNPTALPEVDQDGIEVYAYINTETQRSVPVLLAPITGNPQTSVVMPGSGVVVRVRAHALDPIALTPQGQNPTLWMDARIWDGQNNQGGGWVMANDFPAPVDPANDPQAFDAHIADIQNTTVNCYHDYGHEFQTAFDLGTLPNWNSFPTFTRFPISAAAACDITIPTNGISGLGVPTDLGLYGRPGYHRGVDFFAPDGADVFSIGSNGLVVGIGINDPNSNVTGWGATHWGSAVVDGARGYSVIARYGHLIVLYGHLYELNDNIFVGAILNAGESIGQIGAFNDPHVHIEVLNLSENPITGRDPVTGDAENLSTIVDGPGRQFGFLRSFPDSNLKAIHLYDVTQFFSSDPGSPVTTVDGETVTGLGIGLSDNGSDEVTISGSCPSGPLDFRTIPILDETDNKVGGYRGFISGEELNVPISPSTIPTIPNP